MPTTIYDSSLITQRRRDTTTSGSFVSRISPWNIPPSRTSTNQPTTSYGPMLGIYDQSIVNTVKNGNMRYYTKTEGGIVAINNGCPCVPLTSSEITCG